MSSEHYIKLHALLEKQVAELLLPGQVEDENIKKFIAAVDAAYKASDLDRDLTEYTFRVSELELLRAEAATKQLGIKNLKEAVRSLRDAADEKLDKKELQRLSMVASTNENGIVFTRPDGKIFWSNDGFSKLTGYSKEEVIGKTPIELCRGELSDKESLQEMLMAFYSGKTFDIEIAHYRKDGSWFHGRARGQSILNEHGMVLQYYAMVEDISQLKEKEEALRRSEEKYRGIIANMNLGLIEVDLEDRIVYVNHSFCEISGYSKEDLLGQFASRLFLREENETLLQEKKTLRAKGVSDAYEVAVKTKQGEPRWWLVSGAPMYDQKGHLVGSIGIHLDITKQKQLEQDLVTAKQQAEDSSRAKQVFLANMSHEIRTPMNGILGMARQLSRSDLNGKQRFYLETISSAAENLLVILNDILDLSKIEAGQLTIENISFQLRDVVKRSLNVISQRAEEKGIALGSFIGDDIADVLVGDPHRLNQLLLNLVGNAIKFTEKGSVQVNCVLLETKDNQQKIQFSVADTGIGMDPGFVDKIFDKFLQEDRSTSRKYGGTGLGMSISKQLVKLMDGDIRVSSKKGVGTTVIFELPFVQGRKEDLEAGKGALKNLDTSAIAGKRILLVDDNELNQLVVLSTLDFFKAQTSVAGNGIEALDKLQQEEYDLVLMDMQMPEMGGVEATGIIRGKLKMDIPVIALTANALKEERDRCQQAGMNDFIAKPFEEEDLIQVLCRWLGKDRDQPARTGSQKDVAPAHTTPPEALYSLELYKKLSRGDDQFLLKMISVFQEETKQAVTEIKKHFANNDLRSLERIAHKIRPGIDSLQIPLVETGIAKLEKCTAMGKDETEGWIQQLEKTLGKVHKELENEATRLMQ